MDADGDDTSTQVLVWDCSGPRKLKMPIRELYDKIGKTTRPSPISKHSMRIFQDPRTSSRSTFPRKAV
jgi:hypothetical protein